MSDRAALLAHPDLRNVPEELLAGRSDADIERYLAAVPLSIDKTYGTLVPTERSTS